MDDTDFGGHLFLSYAREDRDRVEPIASALSRDGWQVWWDRENLPPGGRFHQIISDAIEAASCVVVCWSERSVESDWVVDEAGEGKRLGKLLPVSLDGSLPPLGFRSFHSVNLSAWAGDPDDGAYQRLAAALASYDTYRSKPESQRVEEPGVVGGAPKQDSVEEGERAPAFTDSPPGKDAGADEVGGRKNRAPQWYSNAVSLFRSRWLWLPIVALPVSISVFEIVKQVASSAPSLPELIDIPAGCFLMGSPDGVGYDYERPQHEVCLDAFQLGRTEVTVGQYAAFAFDVGRSLPADPGWEGGKSLPVVNVTWNDAQDYAEWLSRLLDRACGLPSEAQWEYAARAGTTTAYAIPAPGGSDDIAGDGLANCDGCGSQWDNEQAAPVGSFRPNDWGLYDMHGNVWEWIQDSWHDDYTGAPADGSAWEGSGPRVLRGGSWSDYPDRARSSNRSWYNPDLRDFDVGFRVMCSSPIPR